MEQATCGHGLAEHSALHATIARLIDAVAANLELHLTALDPSDPVSRPEYDAYTDLSRRHRDLAKRLREMADRMADHRDLPMANHDADVLTGPDVVGAFRELIVGQEELVELLQRWLEQERAMIAAGDAGRDT